MRFPKRRTASPPDALFSQESYLVADLEFLPVACTMRWRRMAYCQFDVVSFLPSAIFRDSVLIPYSVFLGIVRNKQVREYLLRTVFRTSILTSAPILLAPPLPSPPLSARPMDRQARGDEVWPAILLRLSLLGCHLGRRQGCLAPFRMTTTMT